MTFKSGFVAIVGRPNAGKSTLINALLQQKIAIVSDKPQTTRNAIRGILTTDTYQIIFIDTPGIHKPKHKLGRNMNKESYASLSGVDVIYYIIDATQSFGSGDQFVLDVLKNHRIPVVLIVNKIDLLTKEGVMKVLANWEKVYPFKEIIPISALKENNLDRLLSLTLNYLEDGVAYYPIDQVSDYPIQFIIAEIIREKVLKLTEQEIPHSVAVVIENMNQKKDKLIIQALVVVERDSQKGMIIGKQGQMIKKIGQLAREELEMLMQGPVYLELYARVEKNWRDRQNLLSKLGYVEPEIDDE